MFRKIEKFQEAIVCYTEELKHGEKNVKTFNNRAYCFAKLKNFKEAINDYTSSIMIDPQNVHALHNRGICYERMGFFRNVTFHIHFSGN